MSTDKIKVLIAEDMPGIQKRLKRILNSDNQIEVVSCVSNGYATVLQTAIHRPDVVLADVEMEDKEDGLRAASEILDKLPNTKVVILTVHKEDSIVFSAYKIGVTDYILKNAKSKDIIKRVKDAYMNKSSISAEVAQKIKKEFKRIKSMEDSFLYSVKLISQLTPTEIDIIKMMREGNTRNDICEKRVVQLSTVKSQINSILKKMGKSSMKEVVHFFEDNEIFNLLD